MMFFRNSDSEKKGKEVISYLYYFSENQMLDCNQYCIINKDTDEIALFDAGNGLSLPGLFKGMEKQGLEYTNITKVFLTHEHVDHVIGIYPLLEALKDSPPEIYAYGETTKILIDGDESRILPTELGITSKMFGINIVPIKVIDLLKLHEVQIGSDFSFEIYYTPGHSLGSISYYDAKNKILIPGDLVFIGGSFGRYDFPGGSLTELQNSIKNVSKLDVKYLLPGHMGISNDGNRQIQFSLKMALKSNDYV